jgi:hypothetical protein
MGQRQSTDPFVVPFAEQRQSGGFWPETLLAKQVTRAECDLSYPRISREAFLLAHARFVTSTHNELHA